MTAESTGLVVTTGGSVVTAGLVVTGGSVVTGTLDVTGGSEVIGGLLDDGVVVTGPVVGCVLVGEGSVCPVVGVEEPEDPVGDVDGVVDGDPESLGGGVLGSLSVDTGGLTAGASRSPPLISRLAGLLAGIAHTMGLSVLLPRLGSNLFLGRSSSWSSWEIGKRSQFDGSVWIPLTSVSKCRWHPVDDPVVPTCAITSPTFTDSPCSTAVLSKWL